jgi:hypothetical protein
MASPSLVSHDIATNVPNNANEPLMRPEDLSADYDLQQSHMRAILLNISALFRNLAHASGPLPVDPELGNLIPMFTLPAPHPHVTNEQSNPPRRMHTTAPAKFASRESLVNGMNEQLLGEDSLVAPPEVAANKSQLEEECATIPSEGASVESDGGREEDEEEELMKEFCAKYDPAETLFLWERCILHLCCFKIDIRLFRTPGRGMGGRRT